MKKKYNNSSKYKKVTILTLLLCVVVLTIGYSALSTELNISNTSAIVRAQKDIRITGINLANSSSNAISNWEEYNVSSIASRITLPNSDSTITYNVAVTNIGNIEVAISAISGLPNNLSYSISNYSLNTMLCDDIDSTKCTLGATTTLAITIGYVQNGYDSTNTDYSIGMDFTFGYMVDAVAIIGNKLYDTLQKAINAVPVNTPTTIKLLNNTNEIISVAQNKNIVFDLNGRTVGNNGNNPVITNNGTIEITNGTIFSNAPANGAINNESYGTLTINSASVVVAGGRQALYNNKGIATITGSAYLSSVATERAAVQNVAGSTLTITGGIIILTGFNALQNAGTMTIGTKDGNIDKNFPMIQGILAGISSTTNYNFYDGMVKGVSSALDPVTRATDVETGYNIISSEESIGGTIYKTAHLGIGVAVIFNYGGGNVTEATRYIEIQNKIGTLPTTYRAGYDFDGWYTASSGGVKITPNTIVTSGVEYYAHWIDAYAAMIGTTQYRTLQNAINAVNTSGTQTTITLLRDTSENLKTKAGQNILFNFQTYTLSPLSASSAVIENYATMTIVNGTISSNGTAGVINNNSGGRIIVSGGSIIATGTKQAIYNYDGGFVEITGDAYLSSTATGTPSSANMERATAQNLLGGTMNITGGTIIGINQQAVSNEGTLTIGNKDGIIDATSPVIIGATYGIKSASTFNFYDGIIKGKTNAISGTISDQETNSQLVSGTETINGNTYRTNYLEN